MKDEIEKALSVADISGEDVQSGGTGPRTIKQHHELIRQERYRILVEGDVQSIIEDFGNYLRSKVDLVDDDIEMILKQ